MVQGQIWVQITPAERVTATVDLAVGLPVSAAARIWLVGPHGIEATIFGTGFDFPRKLYAYEWEALWGKWKYMAGSDHSTIASAEMVSMGPWTYTMAADLGKWTEEAKPPGDGITLPPGGNGVGTGDQALTIHVQDVETKKGIPGATVKLLSSDRTKTIATTTTTNNGDTRFSKLAPGFYDVDVSAPGYSAGGLTVNFTATLTQTIDLSPIGKPPPIEPCNCTPPGAWYEISGWWEYACCLFDCFVKNVQSFLSDPWGYLIGHFWDNLPPEIKGIAASISGFFPSWVWDLLRWFNKTPEAKGKDLAAPIQSFLSGVLTQLSHLEFEASPDTVALGFDWSKYGTMQKWMGSLGIRLFAARAERDKTRVISTIVKELSGGPGTLTGTLRPIGEAFLKPYQDLLKKYTDQLTGAPGKDPAKAASDLGNVIAALGITTSIVVWIVDMAIEAGSLGISKATGKGLRDALKTFGLPALSSEFSKAPITYGVTPWLGRYYDSLFRTHIYERDLIDRLYIRDPTKRETWLQHYRWYGFSEPRITEIEANLRDYPYGRTADQMLFEGHIEPGDWKDLYRKAGWRDKYIDAHLKTIPREPGERLLIRLLDVAPQFETTIRQWLKQNGYFEPDLSKMMELFFSLSYLDEIKSLVSKATKDYAEGRTSAAQLELSLENLERPAGEIVYRKALGSSQWDAENTERRVKLLKGQAKKNTITPEVFRTKLRELGLQPERIDLEVLEAAPEAAEKEPQIFTEATLRRLYLHNKITAQKYADSLIAKGWMEDDAWMQVEDADIQRIQDERNRLALNALDDLDFGRADEDETRTRLDELAYSQDEIDLKIAATWNEHDRKYAKELAAIHVKDFQEDVANEDQLVELLEGDGLKDWRIKEILYAEKERKIPAEARGG